MSAQAQTGPAAVGGPAAGEVNAPRVIEMDRLMYLAASRRADGWTKVIVRYDVCPVVEGASGREGEVGRRDVEDDDWDPSEEIELFERCVKEVHYFIPSQRNPVRLKEREYRRWYSDKYVRMWLGAVSKYIEDVKRIIEFAAARAPSAEAAEALRRFDLRVVAEPPEGLITMVGIRVGSRAIPIGAPPESIYISLALVDVGKAAWALPLDERELIKAVAFTALWKGAVENVAGCKVEYAPGGSAKIICGSDVMAAEAVLPINEAFEKAHELKREAAGL